MQIIFKILTLILISKFGLAETISGNWSTPCKKNKDRFHLQKIIFDSPYLKYAKSTFDDEKCKSSYSELIKMTKYQVLKPENSRYWNIDYTLENVYLRPTSKKAVDTFNNNNHCGLAQWQLGQFKNVAGLWCGNTHFAEKGSRAYNKLMQENNKLHLNFDASSANSSSRPKTLGKIFYNIER